MTLATITDYAPEAIYDQLPVVIAAFEQGSVITIDNSISVFAKLCKANNKYEKAILPILLKHLKECRPSSVPQHAERASVCFNKSNATTFKEVLETRIQHLSTPGQKRVNKLLKSLNKTLRNN